MTDLLENTRRYRFDILTGAEWMFDISMTPALYDIRKKKKSMIKYVQAMAFSAPTIIQ